MAPNSDENSKKNDSLEKADDNSYAILLEKGIVPLNGDEPTTQRSGEIDPAAPPSEQSASTTFLEQSASITRLERVHSRSNTKNIQRGKPWLVCICRSSGKERGDCERCLGGLFGSTEPPLNQVVSNDVKDASHPSSHRRKWRRQTLPKVAMDDPSNVPESLELSSATALKFVGRIPMTLVLAEP